MKLEPATHGPYTCAAELWRAIRAAAELAPDDDFARGLPDWRPADPGEPADVMTITLHAGRQWIGGQWVDVPAPDLQATAAPMVAMHGPARPPGVLWARFVLAADGARSSLTVRATRARLLELADTVRKHWGLYGGGPLPAELVKPRAPRRAATWPAAALRAWRLLLQEGDHAGAMMCADGLGAVYFPTSGKAPALALAAPIQVEGLPDGVCSALRDDGRYVVSCMVTGRMIGEHGAGSRARAESDALARVADKGADALAARLADVRREPADTAAARAAWCTAHGIEDPAEPAALAPVAPEPVQAIEVPAAVPAADPACAGAPPVAPIEIIATPNSTNRGDLGQALPWQILAARPHAVYATPVRRIGTHEWCTVVYAHGRYAACTDHVWRRVDSARFGGEYEGGRFYPARDWPTYDSDRTHSGLPLTLGKLYAAHESEIRAALDATKAGQVPVWCDPVVGAIARDGAAAVARFDAEMRKHAPAVAAPPAIAAATADPASTVKPNEHPQRNPDPDPQRVREILRAALEPLQHAAADGAPTMAGLLRAAARLDNEWLSMLSPVLGTRAEFGVRHEAANYSQAAADLRKIASAAPNPAPVAPTWFTAERAAVYRAHVETWRIASELEPGPCGPCDDNPRQWMRRPALAPDAHVSAVMLLRARVARAVRQARAARAALASLAAPTPHPHQSGTPPSAPIED